MDYKKIFKTRAVRAAVLNCLRFIPDKTMLRIQYWIKTGRTLNLKNPKRYTEKLQWYKLYYRNPVMHQCVHKYEVRDYVAKKGLQDILVDSYGHFRSADEIDWEKLPDSFVLKTTNGGGGLRVVLCHDKSTLNIDEVKQQLPVRKAKTHSGGREWAYYGLQPGIIAEQLLVNRENPEAGVNDYKIFCYRGKPKYIIVDVDRYVEHKRNFYDTDWNRLNITSDCPAADREVERPQNLEEMLKAAAKLSEDFPYVRVDLYNVDGKVYFGELTFYPWSGYVQFDPDETDYLFGEDFELVKE